MEDLDSPNIVGVNFEGTIAGIDLHLAQKLTTKLNLDLAYASQYFDDDGDSDFNHQMASISFRYAWMPKRRSKSAGRASWPGSIKTMMTSTASSSASAASSESVTCQRSSDVLPA